MYEGKLGVAIISFDRPHYFERMLNSVAQNTYLKDTDFHLFQDGAVCRFTRQQATQNKIKHRPVQLEKHVTDPLKVKKCVELFSLSSLPNKHKHVRHHNVSIAINQFEAMEELSKHYEYVWILEDDVILSPHYLRLLRILMGQFQKDDKVFSVSMNFKKRCEPNEVQDKLNVACYLREHWWAECIKSEKWQEVRPTFMRYYELVRNCPYEQRPREQIRELFQKDIGVAMPADSQDAAKDVCVIHHKLNRINTLVNRGMYIGEVGVHFQPRRYKELKFHEQEPYIFPEDEHLTEFKFE